MGKEHQRRVEALNRSWKASLAAHPGKDCFKFRKEPPDWFEWIFNEGYLAGYEAALLPREEKEDEIPS